MAVTEILLSDPVTQLVTKTNTIASDLGDAATLSTTATNLVAAINEINAQVNKVDSADVINLIQANAMDSAEVLALIKADSGETSIMSNFQKDSANGIGFDSSQGRFFIPSNTINASMIEINAVTSGKIAASAVTSDKIGSNAITEIKMADDAISSAELKAVVTLNIYNAGGSIVKTLYGAGS